MIQDARHILRVADADGIRRKIDQILAAVGYERHPVDHPVRAYVNRGRWVADCDCAGGIACWDQLETGTCADCGAEYPVEWPEPDARAAAEATLSARAKAIHRNWLPWKEPLPELEAETTLLEGVL